MTHCPECKTEHKVAPWTDGGLCYHCAEYGETAPEKEAGWWTLPVARSCWEADARHAGN